MLFKLILNGPVALGSGSVVNEIIVVVLQRYSDRCWFLVGQVAEGSACCRATATGQINKRHKVAPCRLVHELCLKIRGLRLHSFLSSNLCNAMCALTLPLPHDSDKID